MLRDGIGTFSSTSQKCKFTQRSSQFNWGNLTSTNFLLDWPLMRKENSSERQHPIKRKKGVFLSKQPKSFPQQRLSKKHFCWSGCKSGISIVDSVTVPSKSFYIKNNPLPKNKRGTNQHMSGKNWKKNCSRSVGAFFLFYLERNGGGVGGSAINHFLAVVKNYKAWYW